MMFTLLLERRYGVFVISYTHERARPAEGATQPSQKSALLRREAQLP